MTKGRIALSAAHTVYFFDKQGNAQDVPVAAFTSQLSGLTVDENGNLYVAAAAGVYSLDATGRKRWYAPYGSVPVEDSSVFFPGPLALSPDGVLYVVNQDNRLRAIRASDGGEIWSRAVDGSKQFLGTVAGGAGGAVIASWNGGTGATVYSITDGSPLGKLSSIRGELIPCYPGKFALGWSAGIVAASGFDFDICGRQKWEVWTPDRPHLNVESGIISTGELVIASAFESDSAGNGRPVTPWSVSLLDADGSAKAGPVQRDGKPFLAGADGTIYMVYDNQTTRTIQLVALAPDLAELWRLDLGRGEQPAGNGVLDDDGVLYLARKAYLGPLELLAIQTRSPGLADSSWPSLRHDNRGTSWLVPWKTSDPTTDTAGDAGGDLPVTTD